MQAIIMAGGEGSRLRPLTCDIPKPMVPLVNKPVMEHTVDLLREVGWNDIGVTLQYLPQEIIDYFGNGSRFNVKMQYFIEDIPLGTAGSVKNASKLIKDTFLVISGDALTDFDLKRALAFHKEKGSWATLILKQVNIPLEYGVVITEPGGGITRFLEKPGWGEVFSDTVNTGIYILEPQVLDYIPPNKKFDFSKDLFPLLMEQGKPMYGYQAEGYWCDIGSLEQYHQANIDIMLGKAGIKGLRENRAAENIWLGKNVRISDKAQIQGPVIIGDNCVIGDNARIGPFAVLGSHCKVGANASVARSVLWNGVSVGPVAQVKGAVLCSQVTVQARSSIFEGAVLGDRVMVESMVKVRPGVKVWPEKTIGKDTILKDNLVWGNTGKKNVFGSAGISGGVNVEILPEYATRVGAAYGVTIGSGKEIMLSSDGTGSSRMVKMALASGVLSVGCNVVDVGEATMPLHRFGIRFLGSEGGIHVEQSGDNIRIRLSDARGVPISRNTERKIESHLQREDFPRASVKEIGTLKETKDITSNYISHLFNMADHKRVSSRQPKIVSWYRGDNSRLGNNLIESLLKQLGCQVIVCPFEEMEERVKRERADFGVIISDSGEKFELIDETGRRISKDDYYTLVASLLLNREGDLTVAVPVNVPGAVEKVALKQGGKVVRTKVSPQQYLDELFKEQYLNPRFGIPQHLIAFDGLAGLISLIDFLTSSGSPLSAFVDSLPKVYNTKRSIDCSWEDKGKVMRSLIEEHTDNNVELIDGIKVFREDGWALILPDVEEPLYHVYSEGADFEIAESLADFYVDKIKNLTGVKNT